MTSLLKARGNSDLRKTQEMTLIIRNILRAFQICSNYGNLVTEKKIIVILVKLWPILVDFTTAFH